MLNAEEVVCLTQIRDWEVFCKLPLKLGNFVDRVADEAEVVNMGEDEGEISVVQLNEDTWVSSAGFKVELEKYISKLLILNAARLA